MPLIRKCCAQNCEAKQHTYPFPRDDNLRQIWVEFVRERKPDFQPMKTSRLCFRHFHIDQFNNYYPYQHGINCRLCLNRENDRPIPTIHIPEQGYSPLTPRQLINVTIFTPETRKKVVDTALAMEQVSKRLENERKRRLEVPLLKQNTESFKVAPITANGSLSKTSFISQTTFTATNTFNDITSPHHASLPNSLDFGLDHYSTLLKQKPETFKEAPITAIGPLSKTSSRLQTTFTAPKTFNNITSTSHVSIPDRLDFDLDYYSTLLKRKTETFKVAPITAVGPLSKTKILQLQTTSKASNTFKDITSTHHSSLPDRLDFGLDHYGDEMSALLEGDVKTEPRGRDLPNDVEFDHQSNSGATARFAAAAENTSNSYKTLDRSVKQEPTEADNHTLSQQLIVSLVDVAAFPERSDNGVDYYGDRMTSLIEGNVKTEPRDVELDLPNDVEIDYQSISAALSTVHTSESYNTLGKPAKGVTVKHEPIEADNETLLQELPVNHGGIAVTSNRLNICLDYYSDELISLSERDTKTEHQDLDLSNGTVVPMFRTTIQSPTSASFPIKSTN